MVLLQRFMQNLIGLEGKQMVEIEIKSVKEFNLFKKAQVGKMMLKMLLKVFPAMNLL